MHINSIITFYVLGHLLSCTLYKVSLYRSLQIICHHTQTYALMMLTTELFSGTTFDLYNNKPPQKSHAGLPVLVG